MRHYIVAVLVVSSLAATCLAQDAANTNTNADPATTLVIARTGIRSDAPHVATYHYLEVIQTCGGKWICADVGYIDFGTNHYHEMFVGGGRTLVSNDRGSLAEEILLRPILRP